MAKSKKRKAGGAKPTSRRTTTSSKNVKKTRPKNKIKNTPSTQNSNQPKGILALFKQKTTRNILAVILALTVMVYGSSLNNALVNFDDLKHITTNPTIQNFTFANVVKMFTEPINLTYRPLSFLSFSILFQIGQVLQIGGDNPILYHSLSLVFHLINIVLVFYFIQFLTKRIEAATIVAALFALHPMHVESVAWISALNDVLYGCFAVASLITYSKYANNGQQKYLFYTGLWFLLAILSKPLAITLPVLYVLMDYYYGKNWLSIQRLIQKVPFILIGVLIAYVSVWARNVETNEIQNITGLYGFTDRIFFAFYGLLFYLQKLFIPINLSAFHAFPLKAGNALPMVYYAAPILLGLLVVSLYFAKRFQKILVFGFLFFFINVALVLQLIPFGETVVAERYTYLSYVGLFYIIAQVYIWMVDGKFKIDSSLKQPILYSLVGIGLIFAVLSWHRTKAWKNGITLFKNITDQYPTSRSALSGLGHAYIKYEDNYVAAIGTFNQLIEYYPDNIDAYNSRGNAKFESKDYEGAIIDYNYAIEKRPDNIKLLYNRCESYIALQNNQAAIQDAQKIIELDAGYGPAYEQLGHAYFNLNQLPTAIDYYNKNLELAPYNANVLFFRGVAYHNSDNNGQACVDWQQALSYNETRAQGMIDQYCPKE